MTNKIDLPSTPILLNVDLKRTERPDHLGEMFYWDGDILVHVGQARLNMANGLSQLSPSIKESFKQHLISFTKQGNYSPNSLSTYFSVLRATLNKHPAKAFDINWMVRALSNPGFHGKKSMATHFFLNWKQHNKAAVHQDALHFLDDIAAQRAGPRNVLSDDPEKSWFTNEEYDALLNSVWANYDNGTTGTQVTLIRLLSMQYARRPIQIALLKAGDIYNSDGSTSHGLKGCIVDFPGAKDINAETSFRDSKFEPHPLADHLWDLCQVQRHEVKELYEHTLGFTLTEDQLNKLPLFCSEQQIQEARDIIENHYQLKLIDNLNSEHFHLHRHQITRILRWELNTPTCLYGVGASKKSLRPKTPISPRTGKSIIVNANRMRHTRARQLARQGVSRSLLSHWLGHTSEKSLDAYYNDPAEEARQLDEAMSSVLTPIAMAFAGTLIDSEDQATRGDDPSSKLEFAHEGKLKSVGNCGKHSFCATSSVPIPCYRCKYFEPLVDAPHQEVLDALEQRQAAEQEALKIGGLRNLLIPIDLTHDINAVKNCIARCNSRIAVREIS